MTINQEGVTHFIQADTGYVTEKPLHLIHVWPWRDTIDLDQISITKTIFVPDSNISNSCFLRNDEHFTCIFKNFNIYYFSITHRDSLYTWRINCYCLPCRNINNVFVVLL